MSETKVLLVYYSRSGNTAKLADLLARELQCDTEQVQDVRSRQGLFGWLRSGFEAARKRLPAIQEPKHNPTDYELVIIGTPVWASTMSSPMRSYLNRYRERLPTQLAFFRTMAGNDPGRTFAEMAAFCSSPALATLAVTQAALNQNTVECQEFLTRIRARLEGRGSTS
ncbi:MAG: NAD(P)H-dependent oxidoreductase [candidate division WOR-3 bacterium]